MNELMFFNPLLNGIFITPLACHCFYEVIPCLDYHYVLSPFFYCFRKCQLVSAIGKFPSL